MTLSHFNKIFKKFWKWAALLIVSFVGLTLILSGGLVLTLVLAKHNGKLNQWILQATGWEVHYQEAFVGWHNFDPSITLEQVSLQNPGNPNLQFQLQKFQVNISAWPTVLTRSLRTSAIILDGLNLKLTELTDNAWVLNGMQLNGTSTHAGDAATLVNWLLAQQRISLNNLNLTVNLASGKSFSFNPVSLSWYGTKHNLELSAAVPNLSKGELYLSCDFDPAADIGDFNNWQIHFNGNFVADDFSPLFLDHDFHQLKWLSGGGQLSFSGLIAKAELKEMQAELNLSGLQFSHADRQTFNLSELKEQISWENFGAQGWQLRIEPIANDGMMLGAPTDHALIITYQPQNDDQAWQISAHQLDLGFLGQLIEFGMPADNSIAKLWSTLALQGSIQTLNIVGGVKKGSLSFQGNKLSIARNNVFPQGLPPSNLNVDASWQEDAKAQNYLLNIATFNLSTKQVQLSTQGTVKVPLANPQNPYLNLNTVLEGHELQTVKAYYIPQKLIEPALNAWLNSALVKLPLVTARMQWQGKLQDFPYLKRPGNFHLSVKVQDGVLAPWASWPLISDINANINLTQQALTIDAVNAKTGMAVLNKVHFELPNLYAPTAGPMLIRGTANPSGAQLFNYLAIMPLTGPQFKSVLSGKLTLSGTVPLSLQLRIPLNDKPLTVKTTANFNGNNVQYNGNIRGIGLNLNNINGVLNFNNAIVSTPALQLNFDGFPLTLTINKSPLDPLSITLPTLSFFGQNFQDVDLQIQQAEGGAKGQIQTPLITMNLHDSHANGQIVLNPEGNIDADFDKLVLLPPPVITAPQNGSVNNVGAMAKPLDHLSLWLKKIPPLNVDVQNFYYGTHFLGKLYLLSAPMPDGIAVQQIKMGNQDVSIDAAGSIGAHAGSDEISMAGAVQGGNFGRALDQFGYPGVLKNGSGSIQFQFSWLGDLFQPQWATLQGKAAINLSNGAFLQINTSIARLLGLVSLNTVMNTLSLNFTSIFQEGLAFDSFKANYVIENGIAHTDNMSIKGSALDVNVKGDIDLVNHTVDQTISIKPQVGNSIALAAVFLGGPIIGAATWLANEVLGNTLFKEAGLINYFVQGPWDKPQAKLVKSQS